MKVGPLNKWVLLQRPDYVEGDDGEAVLSWVTVDTIPVAIEPLSAREFIQSGANQNQVVARITMVFRSDILPTWRMVDTRWNKVYGISGILPDKLSGESYLTVPVFLGPSDGE